jgi:hypothetical protein
MDSLRYAVVYDTPGVKNYVPFRRKEQTSKSILKM